MTEPVAILGTNRAGASPRLVPFTFAPIGELEILSAVDAKPKKSLRLARLADIERDPRVTVLAHHYDHDWARLWWVRAEGHAAIHTERPPSADALIARYAQYGAQPPQGPWIVITLTRLTGWRASDALSG